MPCTGRAPRRAHLEQQGLALLCHLVDALVSLRQLRALSASGLGYEGSLGLTAAVMLIDQLCTPSRLPTGCLAAALPPGQAAPLVPPPQVCHSHPRQRPQHARPRQWTAGPPEVGRWPPVAVLQKLTHCLPSVHQQPPAAQPMSARLHLSGLRQMASAGHLLPGLGGPRCKLEAAMLGTPRPPRSDLQQASRHSSRGPAETCM